MKTLDSVPYYLSASGRLSLDPPPRKDGGGKGEWCWVEDEAEGWVATTKARCPAGKNTLPLSASALERPIVDDLVMLDEITEGLICHTLRKRYEADSFCTTHLC